MPNLVKFREDPDAMLVMALEDYDEVTGKAAKAAILQRDVVGKTPAGHHRRVRRGRAAGVARPQRRPSTCPSSPSSTASPRTTIIAELGDLIYHDPRIARPGRPPTNISRATSGPSWRSPRRPGRSYARNAEALRPVQPEDVLPGDIDANLGAPWIPASDIQAFAAELFRVAPIGDPDRPPEEGRGLERRRRPRRRSVGRRHRRIRHARANGTWLLELALNMKTPGHLRHDPGRQRRGAGRQPGRDARRPREAEADQGAVPLLGLRRSRPHRSAWFACITTPTTICGRDCSTARTSISPA